MASIKNRIQALLCASILTVTPLVISADNGYSTENDPLITLSYAKTVLKEELKKEILAEMKIENLTAQIREKLESELKAKLITDLTKTLTVDLTESITKAVKESVSAELKDELAKTLYQEWEDELIPKIEAQIREKVENEIVAEVTQQLKQDLTDSLREELTRELTEKLQSEMSEQLYNRIQALLPEDLAKQNFRTVSLTKGQTIRLMGSCEIVLTSGLARCLIDDMEQGSALDLQDGYRIRNGDEILQNHLTVVTGSGCSIDVIHTEANIMIRGEYQIAEPEE